MTQSLTTTEEKTQMTDKERLSNILEAHINTTAGSLKESQAKFGTSVMDSDSWQETRDLHDECRRLEGQKEGLELAKALVESEL